MGNFLDVNLSALKLMRLLCNKSDFFAVTIRTDVNPDYINNASFLCRAE